MYGRWILIQSFAAHQIIGSVKDEIGFLEFLARREFLNLSFFLVGHLIFFCHSFIKIEDLFKGIAGGINCGFGSLPILLPAAN